MDKPKPKNSALLRGRAVPFTALWVASYLIACLISFFLVSIVGLIIPIWFRPLTPRYPVLLIFLMIMLPALFHTQVIERLFKQSMRGWFRYTLLGAILTTLLLLQLNPGTYWSVNSILYDAPIYFLGGTIVQTVWLWRHVKAAWRIPFIGAQLLGEDRGQTLLVKAAWLWPLIGVLSMIVSFKHPFLLRLMPGTEIFLVLWLAVYSLGQGAFMHYLLSRPHNTQKAKVDFAAYEDRNDSHRTERLQEGEQRNPLWDAGDEQALQSEA